MNKNYDLRTVDMLTARYPYQFDKENIGLTFYRGWLPIIAGVCTEIDELLGPHRELFHWIQIKEKFSACRMYYSLGGDTDVRVDVQSEEGLQSFNVFMNGSQAPAHLKQAVAKLVAAAEAETSHSCIVCGQAAQLDNYDGYYVNLCPGHRPQEGADEAHWSTIWKLARL